MSIGLPTARVACRVRLVALAGLALLLAVTPLAAQDAATAARRNSRQDRVPLPPPVEQYMGRLVAQTMHFSGAEWLIRDEREREERCSLMLANLGVKRGTTVCDLGCGNGFYSLQLARMVGEQGQVLAVDIQPEMLYLLRERAEAEGIGNVSPILGSYHDPRLPRDSIDLVLLVDVYHEFSHPQHMLAAIRRALKDDGVVVLVEYRGEDPSVPIKPLHKMTQEQVDLELVANGFKRVSSYDELPWQHMLFYGRDPQWKAPEGYPDVPIEAPAANTPRQPR